MFDHEAHSVEIKHKSFYDNLISGWKETDAIPMEDLIAIHAKYRSSHGKTLGILRSVLAILSLISSSIFIWMILRSHKGLSSTQHRLLLGLCICDIIHSLSFSTFNTMAPSDVTYYEWNVRGDESTCDIQGFFLILGACGGLCYNSSLNLYFLAVVKYNKKEEYIRTKIEPYLHAVPIVAALIYSTVRLVKKHYNANGDGICTSAVHYPPHCHGYDVGEIRDGFKIPCGRGLEGAWNSTLSGMILTFIPIMIMVISLGVIYRTVSRQEKKLARYGVGALRANVLQQQQSSTRIPEEDATQSIVWGRVRASIHTMTNSLRMSGPWISTNRSNAPAAATSTNTRSNNTRSQSRAVMRKAFGYSFAWILSYGFYLIGLLFLIIAKTDSAPLVLTYIASIFIPLQGLFNLFIFLYPKVIHARKSKRSWYQAFSVAFWSRGTSSPGKRKGGYPDKRRSNDANRLRRRRRNDTTNMNDPPPTTSRKKRRRHRHQVPPQEEEEGKSEIKIPEDSSRTIQTTSNDGASALSSYFTFTV